MSKLYSLTIETKPITFVNIVKRSNDVQKQGRRSNRTSKR